MRQSWTAAWTPGKVEPFSHEGRSSATSRIRTHSGERPADYKQNALPLSHRGPPNNHTKLHCALLCPIVYMNTCIWGDGCLAMSSFISFATISWHSWNGQPWRKLSGEWLVAQKTISLPKLAKLAKMLVSRTKKKKSFQIPWNAISQKNKKIIEIHKKKSCMPKKCPFKKTLVERALHTITSIYPNLTVRHTGYNRVYWCVTWPHPSISTYWCVVKQWRRR